MFRLTNILKRNTTLPIILKGVQCVEDIQLCVDHGVEGVILVSASIFMNRLLDQLTLFR